MTLIAVMQVTPAQPVLSFTPLKLSVLNKICIIFPHHGRTIFPLSMVSVVLVAYLYSSFITLDRR